MTEQGRHNSLTPLFQAAAGSVPSVPITGSISDLISKKEFNEYERDSIIHSMDTGEEKHKAKSKNLFSSPRGSHGVSDGEASASNNDMLKALEKAAGETEAHAPAGDRSRVGNTGGSSTVGRSGDGGRGDSSTALWNDEERRLDSKEGSLERGLGALMRVADRQKGELESMNSVNTWLHGSA